jgi:AbiV family abortive infection protein
MNDVTEKCKIPLDRIDSGLDLISRNIRRLIGDHYALMKEGSDWHAVGLAIFALEELVKYYVLKQKKDEAIKKQMTSVEVEELLFGRGRGNSHRYKLDIARNEHLIPPETWTIHTARLDRAYFDSAYFDAEDIVVSAALRTRNMFVDWREREWEHGTVLETLRLKNFADSIIRTLDELETKSSYS